MTSEGEDIKNTNRFLITLMLTISASAHSGDTNFLSGKNENETTTREEKATESLGRWTRWKDRSRGAEPQEKVCQASQNREADEQITP